MTEILYASDSTVLEDVRDALKTKLDAIDWTDVSPDIDHVYNNHNQANIEFNAVSIGIVSDEKELIGLRSSSIGPLINHLITVELRIHIAVGERHNDYDIFWRLANSINNFLGRNNELASQMHITEPGTIVGAQTFDESDTVGGSLTFVILYTTAHEAA